MSNFDYAKQAQEYYSKAPLIVLGSGASAAHGLSGMGALAKHLIANVDISDLDSSNILKWGDVTNKLTEGVDLETALQQISISNVLTTRIIKTTWELLNQEDFKVFQSSLQNYNYFPLSDLLEHMFKSSLRIINIVTTNYDRLAEYACEQRKFHYYTGFSHGYFRQSIAANEIISARRVDIWKVHGSLDWFKSPLKDTVAISNIFQIPNDYEPEIVTPGAEKYQKTHSEPFRTIIHNADIVINDATSYLCIGYGFNDEHIQPKLIANCLRSNTPLTIVTYNLSKAALKILKEDKPQKFLAIERGQTDDQSVVHSSLHTKPLIVDKNIWSLSGYLSLVI